MRSTKTPNQNINDSTPDSALMCMVQEGCEPAFNALMHRYKHKIFAFITRYVKDTDAAYDILQDSFIRVYFKAGTYNPSHRFSTWIYQIAINLCRDWGRKNKVITKLSLDTPSNEDSDAIYDAVIGTQQGGADEAIGLLQTLKALDREIHKLPHKLKTALILFAVEGHSQQHCADLLGVTPKTIETRVYRARKILAEKIDIDF